MNARSCKNCGGELRKRTLCAACGGTGGWGDSGGDKWWEMPGATCIVCDGMGEPPPESGAEGMSAFVCEDCGAIEDCKAIENCGVIENKPMNQTREEQLEACLKRLFDAAEPFVASQEQAPHPLCGVTQPITVAEGQELLDAVEDAGVVLGEWGPADPTSI